MKKYACVIIILIGMMSCHTDNIDLYHAKNYISFANEEKDTLMISFFLLGNLSEYNYPIVVKCTGMPADEELDFIMSVVEKSTSAESKYYDLPVTKFRPGRHLDTIYVKLTNSPELQKKSVSLCLELKENEHFLLGDRDFRRIHLVINNNVTKPDWWTPNVETYFLGEYSDEKFRQLVKAAKPNLLDVSDTWIRSWALLLKAHLDKMSALGTPVTEVDGTRMTVTVRI